MAKFRFHRGSLIESISTQVEVNNHDELIKAINKEFADVKKYDISLESYGYDSRINKETYIVMYDDRVLGFYTE